MIRVLIVDDIASTVDRPQKLISFEDDIEICGTANNGQEGVEVARKQKPDLILMDVNMPVMDGIEATEVLATELPTSPVIIMSVQGERDYVRRAMQAGAAEFLIKPFSGDELIAAIHRVHEREQGRKQHFAVEVGIDGVPQRKTNCRVFTIIGSKGGTGKSILAANLAVSLKLDRPQDQVCLLDLSLQFGDVGALFNPTQNRTISDLVEMSDPIEPDFVTEVLADTASEVKLMQAPRSPELADLVRNEHVKALIGILQQQFDFLVIDTGPGINEMCLEAIEAANMVILMTSTNLTALKDAKLTLKVLDNIQVESSKTLIVLNTLDPQPQAKMEKIQNMLHLAIPLTLPYSPEVVNPSVDQGQPFVIQSPDSAISRSMHELVRMLLPSEELATEAAETDDKKKRRPLFKFR